MFTILLNSASFPLWLGKHLLKDCVLLVCPWISSIIVFFQIEKIFCLFAKKSRKYCLHHLGNWPPLSQFHLPFTERNHPNKPGDLSAVWWDMRLGTREDAGLHLVSIYVCSIVLGKDMQLLCFSLSPEPKVWSNVVSAGVVAQLERTRLSSQLWSALGDLYFYNSSRQITD